MFPSIAAAKKQTAARTATAAAARSFPYSSRVFAAFSTILAARRAAVDIELKPGHGDARGALHPGSHPRRGLVRVHRRQRVRNYDHANHRVTHHLPRRWNLFDHIDRRRNKPAFIESRNSMVDRQIVDRLIHDSVVIEAMRAVPRHEFVPTEFVDQAYADHPLPIGHGQTISQPYIVALMSQALDLRPGAKVLEIGTGSGYQAAVLAAMGAEVYTIEIIEQLATVADQRLRFLGYDVLVRNADGYFGWEEHAPFDAIIVTAAPDHLPQPLVGQLAIGGNLVIPIGPIGAVQTLWRFQLDGDGELSSENLGGVFFVPFTHD